MKRLILILLGLSLFFVPLQASARWVSVIPTFTQSQYGLPITDLYFANPDTGWAVGFFQGIYKTTDMGRSWLQVDQWKKNLQLFGVYFLNSQEGWIIGAGPYNPGPGIILHTADGGTTWEEQANSNPDNVLFAVTRVGEEIWAVGWDSQSTMNSTGLLLRSTDHGRAWSQTRFPESGGLDHIEVVAPNNIWLIGRNTVLQTIDNGQTWIDHSHDVQVQGQQVWPVIFRRIAFVNPQVGYLVGNQVVEWGGKFYITIDGGQTWRLRKEWGEEMQPLGMAVSNGTIYVAGGDGRRSDYDFGVVLASSDSGKTWREAYRSDLKWSTLYGGLYQIGQNIWGAGKDFVYFTNDSPLFAVNLGTTHIPIAQQWQYELRATDPDGDPLTFSLLDAPKFLQVDANTGRMWGTPAAGDVGEYRVVVQVSDGQGGTDTMSYVLHVDGQITAVEDEATVGPFAFRLRQNYPNPFNPETTIRYSLPLESNVRLLVYDLTGQEVAVVVNGRQQAGAHQAVFNASHLAGGIYLYRLTADSFTETKKMMLIK